jgi:hypothetical protein
LKAGKFFRHVWRVNSILILFAGMLALAILGLGAFGMLRSAVQSQGAVVDVGKESTGRTKTKLQLGASREIAGSPCVMIPLHSSAKSGTSYLSKSGTRTRNYLFVNAQDLSRTWLFPDNNALVKNFSLLNPDNKPCEESNVVGILYEVIRSDTNRDGRLGPSDWLSVYVSGPNGGNLKEIVSAVDQVMGHRLLDDDLLFLTYAKSGTAHVMKCSLKDPAIREIAEVSIAR